MKPKGINIVKNACICLAVACILAIMLFMATMISFMQIQPLNDFFDDAMINSSLRKSLSYVGLYNDGTKDNQEIYNELTHKLTEEFGDDFYGGQISDYSLFGRVDNKENIEGRITVSSYNSKMFRSKKLVEIREGMTIEKYNGHNVPVYATKSLGIGLNEIIDVTMYSKKLNNGQEGENSFSIKCEVVGLLSAYNTIGIEKVVDKGLFLKDLMNLIPEGSDNYFNESYNRCHFKIKDVYGYLENDTNRHPSDNKIKAYEIIKKYGTLLPSMSSNDMNYYFMVGDVSKTMKAGNILAICIIIVAAVVPLLLCKDKTSSIILAMIPVLVFIIESILKIIFNRFSTSLFVDINLVFITNLQQCILMEIIFIIIITAKYYIKRHSDFSKSLTREKKNDTV